jgi:uncharacterized protein (DUF1015 family)
MVVIRPFKALVYDLEEIQGGPEEVTSPPYDVISEKELRRLKSSSEHNVTHLTLPAPAPGKDESTKYQEANRLLKRWRKESVLFQQQHAALFLYEVTYDDGERRRTATGVGCLVGLDPDYKEVRPHERTHKGPIEDRFELLKATAMDMEPIQFLYRDPEGEVIGALRGVVEENQAAPVLDFTDPGGTHHRLWSIRETEALERVTAWFESQKIYIADGHHRYATALHYAKWRAEQGSGENGGPKGYEHKMAVLMEAGDPGLSVHPTHRLVSCEDKSAERKALQEAFGVEPLRVAKEPKERAKQIQACLQEAAGKRHRFVFDWGDETCDVVTLAPDEVPKEMAPDRSAAWRGLDVSVLHHHVLPKSLGVTQENAGKRLRYTRDAFEAAEAALSGEADCVVLMNPTPQDAVLQVADVMEHMPQKSTYFLPKLQSGLFFSPL